MNFMIKKKVISIIKTDDELKLKLAKLHGLKVSSIEKWIRDGNHEKLTYYRCLVFLKAIFQVEQIEDLLESDDESLVRIEEVGSDLWGHIRVIRDMTEYPDTCEGDGDFMYRVGMPALRRKNPELAKNYQGFVIPTNPFN